MTTPKQKTGRGKRRPRAVEETRRIVAQADKRIMEERVAEQQRQAAARAAEVARARTDLPVVLKKALDTINKAAAESKLPCKVLSYDIPGRGRFGNEEDHEAYNSELWRLLEAALRREGYTIEEETWGGGAGEVVWEERVMLASC